MKKLFLPKTIKEEIIQTAKDLSDEGLWTVPGIKERYREAFILFAQKWGLTAVTMREHDDDFPSVYTISFKKCTNEVK